MCDKAECVLCEILFSISISVLAKFSIVVDLMAILETDRLICENYLASIDNNVSSFAKYLILVILKEANDLMVDF